MPYETVYNVFRSWVDKQPDAVAIVEDDRKASYRELDRMANDIMSKFHDCNYQFIGIIMSHSIEMIAAMLAVLKSGAAYIPAETTLPGARAGYMMETAGAKLVITDGYCKNLPHAEELPDRSKTDGLAYVLFTSGTTGRPKGVAVENHSVVNYAIAFENEFHVGPGDVMLQYSVCSFDIFVEEVFTTLLNGATLAIPSANDRDGSLEDIIAFCNRHGVTEISGFPYLIADMNRHLCYPEKLRLLISGGDVIRAGYINRLKDRGFKIYNTYGPSETTVCATYYRIDDAEPLDDGTFPIGKSIYGVEISLRDKELNEVPDGTTGEICISGEGVSRGYLGNPPEQENFITLQDGTRIYRSGDLGYRMEDGKIAFLHRKDRQVMIEGRRVEPEEVENVLNESPCVERGVVRAYNDDNGMPYLTAYFVPSHRKCSLGRIKTFLKSRLADFMVPEFFVRMEEIPLTRRGKVNDRELPVVMKIGKTYENENQTD